MVGNSLRELQQISKLFFKVQNITITESINAKIRDDSILVDLNCK